MVPFRLVPLLLISLMLAAGHARADPETDQLRDQLRATVLQLRQLQDQQAAAQQPAASPPADLAAVKAKLAAAEAQLRVSRHDAAQVAGLQAALDKLRADNAALTASSAALSAQLENIKAAFGQALDSGRTIAADRERLKAELAQMTAAATACQAKNVRLVAFAESLLQDYRRVGLGHVLAMHDPVLGAKRVQFENLVQDREDTLRGDRCDPRLDAASPAKPAGG